jgi:hypothetical protein
LLHFLGRVCLRVFEDLSAAADFDQRLVSFGEHASLQAHSMMHGKQQKRFCVVFRDAR